MGQNQPRSAIIGVRFTARERAYIEGKAYCAGLRLSDYVRRQTLAGTPEDALPAISGGGPTTREPKTQEEPRADNGPPPRNREISVDDRVGAPEGDAPAQAAAHVSALAKGRPLL